MHQNIYDEIRLGNTAAIRQYALQTDMKYFILVHYHQRMPCFMLWSTSRSCRACMSILDRALRTSCTYTCNLIYFFPWTHVLATQERQSEYVSLEIYNAISKRYRDAPECAVKH